MPIVLPKSVPETSPKLLLRYRMWDRKEGEAAFTGNHAGKAVGFDRLPEARDFAAKNGYAGIKVV